ncbi:hypothetical protein [Haloarchaeobius amylolyticus]|uniref:hypothetical protein n=1 Tax=Haloarchaeobius amylolyticus TaxID=1198296 RepID=UPI00226D91D8|nr:hypothetical protein [Haloarchaeobius amylolyticus]
MFETVTIRHVLVLFAILAMVVAAGIAVAASDGNDATAGGGDGTQSVGSPTDSGDSGGGSGTGPGVAGTLAIAGAASLGLFTLNRSL